VISAVGADGTLVFDVFEGTCDIAATGSRDRETSVEPDHLRGPLRAVDAEGLHQGERVLRFEAIVHNAKQLGCGRTLDRFGQITTRLTAMVDRFTSTLDCVEVGFLPDGILDQLLAPSQLAGTRIGGIDMNIPRVRAGLAAALALAVAPQASPSPSSPAKCGR